MAIIKAIKNSHCISRPPVAALSWIKELLREKFAEYAPHASFFFAYTVTRQIMVGYRKNTKNNTLKDLL
jgi:hypothetical protein